MLMERDASTVREAVGVFRHFEDFQAAIDELNHSGFEPRDFSLLVSTLAAEEKLSHRYEKVRAVIDDPTVSRMAYL